MASLPRPQFFLTRPGDFMIPLIAVDELPPNVQLNGVPRFLTPSETRGMISMGEYPPPRTHYQLVDLSAGRATPTGAGQHHHPNEHEFPANRSYTGSDDIPESVSQGPHAYSHGAASQNWVMHAPTASGRSASTATVPSAPTGPGGVSNKASVNPKKIYCSYWIRHGECDYAQQGCLYKHEMPDSLSMLEKLGLRDIPKWYREKHGVPSIHGHRTQMRSGQQPKGDGAARTAEKNPQHPARIMIEASGNVQSDLPPRNAQNYVPAQRVATPIQTRAYVPQGHTEQTQGQMQGHMNASYGQASNMQQPLDYLTPLTPPYAGTKNAGNLDQAYYPSPEGDRDADQQEQIVSSSMSFLGLGAKGASIEAESTKQGPLIDIDESPSQNAARRVQSRHFFANAQNLNSIFAGRGFVSNAPAMTRAQSSFTGLSNYRSDLGAYQPRPIGERPMSSMPATRKTSPEAGAQSSSPSSSDHSAPKEVKNGRGSHTTIVSSGELKESGDQVEDEFCPVDN